MTAVVLLTLILTAAGLVLSCASAGPSLAAGGAKLTLTRVSGLQYAGVPATVKINGKEVASLWSGSSSTVDLTPGANVITVDASTYPGSWTHTLNAKPGARYTIEISPHSSGTAMLGLVGMAIEASSKSKQGGAFQMRVVPGR